MREPRRIHFEEISRGLAMQDRGTGVFKIIITFFILFVTNMFLAQ